MENSKKIVPRAVYFGIGSFIVFYLVFVVFGTLSGGQAMEALFIFQILLIHCKWLYCWAYCKT